MFSFLRECGFAYPRGREVGWLATKSDRPVLAMVVDRLASFAKSISYHPTTSDLGKEINRRGSFGSSGVDQPE
jgi:hypothetical protein